MSIENIRYTSEVSEIDGVYQIKINIPWSMKFVSVYLIKIDDKNILIDAGYSHEEWKRELYSAFDKELGISIEDIDYCIVTHEHIDHIGLIKDFKQDNPDIKICMHEFVYEIAKLGLNDEKYKKFEDQAREMADQIIKYGLGEKEGNFLAQMFSSRPMRIDYLKPDITLKDNDEISFGTEKLKIIWTPGHSLGHICIFNEKQKHLFSGDHVLSRITPHIGMFGIPEIIEQNPNYNFKNILKLYLQSLDRIDELRPKIMFPGHQEIIYHPHKRILEIKNHHQNRLFEISKAITNKKLTPYQISRIHFGEDLDEMNSILALSEVLGHLIYLEEEGLAFKTEKDGKIYYTCDETYMRLFYK
ncbi:MAG: MBL fold metallo-hydrolase [Promethearchaeota archaeon]